MLVRWILRRARGAARRHGSRQAASAPIDSPRLARKASTNDNPPLERRDAEHGVIVVLARPRSREHAGLAALARCEKAGLHDLGQSGLFGSTPPTTSCARMSLLTNVTRCPTSIVISSGVMPVAVMVMVGWPDGAGAGDGRADRRQWRRRRGRRRGATGTRGSHRGHDQKKEKAQHGNLSCRRRGVANLSRSEKLQADNDRSSFNL